MNKIKQQILELLKSHPVYSLIPGKCGKVLFDEKIQGLKASTGEGGKEFYLQDDMVETLQIRTKKHKIYLLEEGDPSAYAFDELPNAALKV